MPISIQIYSNSNSKSTTINVDFLSQVLVSSNSASWDSTQKSFFKISTTAKDENNEGYPVKIIESASQLALGTNTPTWASSDMANVANVAITDPYPNIKNMVFDHVYDMVNGHAAGANGSDATEKAPMKFS